MSVKSFQSLIRPAVTAGLVGAQVSLAWLWASGAATVGAKEAFAALAPFTMMVVTYWFKSRETEK